MASFDSARFRQVLGHFPTGVTVVTGTADGAPHGMTIGSFTSVSLEPPLVGFLPQASSPSWQAISSSGAFCVNVLGQDQGELCWRFAKTNDDEKSRKVIKEHAQKRLSKGFPSREANRMKENLDGIVNFWEGRWGRGR